MSSRVAVIKSGPRRAIRRFLGAMARRVQSLRIYRTLGRRLRPAFSIRVADEADMAQVDRAFNPGAEARPYAPDPLVTNFVAKRGRSLLGFVQLVRHPEEHFPYVGHWLFSLFVWPQYRGMGVGEELCKRVIALGAEEGANELFLLVYENTCPACNLYRKLVFEVTSIPALEQLLNDETRATGRRRMVMRRSLP